MWCRDIEPVGNDSELLVKLRDVAHRLRLVRAIRGAIRAALAGNLVLVSLLACRLVVPAHPGWYLLILLLPAAVGAAFGLLAPMPLVKVARMLDAQFGLQERLQTAIEFRERRDEPIVQALLEDADGAAAAIDGARAVPLRSPREARYLALVLALVAAVWWLPPLPMIWPTATVSLEPGAQHAESVADEDNRSEDDLEEDGPGDEATAQPHARLDLKVAFKDTPFAAEPPDFATFLSGDEDRVRMFESLAELPGLRHDARQAPHRVSLQQLPATTVAAEASARPPDQTAKRPEETLDSGSIGRGPRETGNDSPQRTGPDQAGELVPKGEDGSDRKPREGLAANQRREPPMEAKRDGLRDGQGTDASRFAGAQSPHDAPGTALPPWLWGPEDPRFQDAGLGEGDTKAKGKTGGLPGRGHSFDTEGELARRIDRRRTQDLRLSGQLRKGEQESYETDLLGVGAEVPFHEPHLDRRNRYRWLSEAALSRERVPFAFRDRVKSYFSAIEHQ